MQAKHNKIVEPVYPFQGKRIKNKSPYKKYDREIFVMSPDEFMQPAVPKANQAYFHILLQTLRRHTIVPPLPPGLTQRLTYKNNLHPLHDISEKFNP